MVLNLKQMIRYRNQGGVGRIPQQIALIQYNSCSCTDILSAMKPAKGA